MSDLSRLLVTVLACTWLTCPALAEEWTRFRGPRGDGHSSAKNTPVNWSSSRNVRWKQEVPGEGWSSPVVSDGQIYLTAAIPSEGTSSDFALCLLTLDASSGALRDTVEVFRQDGGTAPKIHSKNSHASPTAIVEGDRIYVHFGHQGTACVSRDGEVLWRSRELAYAPVHGNGGTPIIVGDALIFSCDGREDPFVAALNKHTGDVLWKTPRETDAAKLFSFSTPTVIEVNGRPQVVSPGSNAVCAFDPLTGREIWRVRYEGYSVIPKPVHGHGLLFLSTSYDHPTLMAIRPDGTGDVTRTHVVWQTDRQAPHTPSPLLVGDELYIVSDRGVASCFDAVTGKPRWQERLGGNFSASPLYADGKIYFQSEQGDTTVIAAGPLFRKLEENSLSERTLASPAVIDSDLLIRTDKHLYRIAAR